MHLIHAVVVALATCATAVPRPGLAFSVTQAHAPRISRRSPFFSSDLKRSQKDRESPFRLLKRAGTQTGSIDTNEISNRFYVGTVGVDLTSLPLPIPLSTSLPLLFDTGSDVDWAIGSQIPVSQRGLKPYLETGGLSPTGRNFSISYSNDTRSVAGPLYNTTVRVGGVSSFGAFGAADTVTSNILADPFSGILGLEPREPGELPNWLQRVFYLLRRPAFTITLRKGGPGTFDFGFLDSAKMKNDPEYMQTEFNVGWSLTSGSYSIGIRPTQSLTARTRIDLDTGSPNVYYNNASVTSYYQGNALLGAQLGADLQWRFPCARAFLLESFTVQLGFGSSKTVTIPAQNLNNGSIPGNESWCLGLLQAKGEDTEPALLGIPFFNQYFVVHSLTYSEEFRTVIPNLIGIADRP